MYACSLHPQQPAYDTCIVVDICQWSNDMTACTKHRFPEVQIRIVHSTASLTGFSVVMKIHAQQQWQQQHYATTTRTIGGYSHREGERSHLHKTDAGCGLETSKSEHDHTPADAAAAAATATSKPGFSFHGFTVWKMCRAVRLFLFALVAASMRCCTSACRRHGSNAAGMLAAGCMFYAFLSAVNYMRSMQQGEAHVPIA